MHGSMRGAIFEARAVCVQGGVYMHMCVQSKDSARGGLTFPTSLFMTGGNRQPHSNITSWVAGASLGRKGWQTERERQRENTRREKDSMSSVDLFCPVGSGDIVLYFHTNKIQLLRERGGEGWWEIKGDTGRCCPECPQMSFESVKLCTMNGAVWVHLDVRDQYFF